MIAATRELSKVLPESAGGLSLSKLEELLSEIEIQPDWRTEGARSAAYYDGKQLDEKVVQQLKERGQAPLVFNLIAPVIDGVLGIEAKTRSTWLVRADNDDNIELALALNERLNEAARMSMADRACSDAYASMIKTGVGWVEVNRSSDPFSYEYRCNSVHRREIFWDWHTKRPDMKDCRYMVRERWLDEDQALLAFPQHERLIWHVSRGWNNWSTAFDMDNGDDLELMHAYSQHQITTLKEETWWDSQRKRVRAFEVWYRVYHRGITMKLPDGRVIEFDKTNPLHKLAVVSGKGKLSQGIYPKMRLSYYLGPHRIEDMASPLPHDSYPYIPFWAFREDGTGIPYGIIRRMMSPQDEVNARRTKMMWLLSAKRIIMDEDASRMSHAEVLDEVQRPDSLIVLDSTRQHRDQWSFRVEQDFQLAAQQFQVMKEAQTQIQECAGIYNAVLGKEDSSNQSGVAISGLVEQGHTTLSEVNDNYRFARQMVGEFLLSLIVEDIGTEEQTVVVDANKPRPTRTIKLNERVTDANGNTRINNDVTRTKAKVVLDDIQSTAGYRAQISNRLFELAATLPDEMKAAVMDIVVDATELPQREELVKRIREVTGVNVDPASLTPEQRAAQEAKQQAQAKDQKLLWDELEAKIEKLRAEASRARASGVKSGAEADSQSVKDRNVEANTSKIYAEMAALTEEVGQMRLAFNKQLSDEAEELSEKEPSSPSPKEGGGTKPAGSRLSEYAQTEGS